MVNIAYAMGAGGGAQGAQGGMAALIPLILMFAIFYFLLIRPQQKKAKEHREMVDSLKKGDRVITTGGIYGHISNLDDTTVTLEIADKVKIKVVKGNITALAQSSSVTHAEKKTSHK